MRIDGSFVAQYSAMKLKNVILASKNVFHSRLFAEYESKLLKFNTEGSNTIKSDELNHSLQIQGFEAQKPDSSTMFESPVFKHSHSATV